ncbi:MAG: ATP-binding protein [Myxococcales bacterium]
MAGVDARGQSGGLRGGDAALEVRVHAEKIRALYGKGLFALVTNLVNSTILLAALWQTLPHPPMLLWAGLTYALAAVRLVRWRQHRRAKESEGYRPRRWELEWLVGLAASGLLWGSASVALYPEHSLGSLYLVLFVIGGMVAGVSATTSSFLPAFVAFAFPAVGVPVVRLCLADTAMHFTMAGLFTIFGFGMTAVAWAGSRAQDEAIRLRFRNTLLVEDLSAVRHDLALLNRQLEERIATRTKELERTVSERDRFVSVVSHELRTPLSTMILNLDLTSGLLSQNPAANLSGRFELLSRQVRRMQRLVEDLMDFSRLSTDRMRYQKVSVELKGLVLGTLEEMAPRIAAAGAADRFGVELADGLVGNWDPGRLQQVLVNLVSNALRYGAAPYSLTARRVDGNAELVVRDSGRGIPTEALTRIFDAFESAHPGPTLGLGLGLHIAAQIVRAHEGTIRAESTPEQGAAFIVVLPLMPQ